MFLNILNKSLQVPRVAKYLGTEITPFYKNRWKEYSKHIALVYPFAYEYLMNDPWAERLILFLSDQANIQVDLFFYPDEVVIEYLEAQDLPLLSHWYQKSINEFDSVVLFNQNPITYSRFKKLLSLTGFTGESGILIAYEGQSPAESSAVFTDDPEMIVAYTLHGKPDNEQKIKEEYQSQIWRLNSWKKNIKPIVPLVNIYPAFGNTGEFIEGLLSGLYLKNSSLGFQEDAGPCQIHWPFAVSLNPFWAWLKDEIFFNHDPSVVITTNPFQVNLMEKTQQHFTQFLAQYPVPVLLPEQTIENPDRYAAEIRKLIQVGVKKLFIVIPGESDDLQKESSAVRTHLARMLKSDLLHFIFVPNKHDPQFIGNFITLNKSMIETFQLSEKLTPLNEIYSSRIFSESRNHRKFPCFLFEVNAPDKESQSENNNSIVYGRGVRRIKARSHSIRKIIRVRYQKSGESRYYSHRDIIRILDKFSKKAGAPLVYTQGKLPRPRISFGPPLAMGYESVAEYADFIVETARETSLKKILNPILPEGIGIIDEEIITGKVPSLSSSILENVYQIDGFAGIDQSQLDSFIAQSEIFVPREKEDSVIQFNIRPHLKSMKKDNGKIILRVRAVDGKMARVQEILNALCQFLKIDMPDEYRVIRLEQYVMDHSSHYTDPISYIRKMKL